LLQCELQEYRGLFHKHLTPSILLSHLLQCRIVCCSVLQWELQEYQGLFHEHLTPSALLSHMLQCRIVCCHVYPDTLRAHVEESAQADVSRSQDMLWNQVDVSVAHVVCCRVYPDVLHTLRVEEWAQIDVCR